MKRARAESANTESKEGEERPDVPEVDEKDESTVGRTPDRKTSTNDAVEDTAESAPAKTADSKADGPEPPPSKTQKTSDGGDGGRNGAPIVGEADPPAKDDSTPSTKPTATAAMGGGVEAGGDGSSSARGKGAGARVAEESTTLPDVEGIPNETLFVGNLSYKVSEAVIIKLFTPFGKVVREQFCYHMVGPRRGEPRGFCFVEYSNVEDAAKAIRALHGRKLYGRPLRVRFMTVEGTSRMDYSATDNKRGTATSSTTYGEGGRANIPPPASAGGEPGVGAGVTKLSLDKKVALLKLKLREASKSGT